MQINVGLMNACMGECGWTAYGKKKSAGRELVEQVFLQQKSLLTWDFAAWSLEWGWLPGLGDRHCPAVPVQAASGTHSSSFRPHLV